ncbi:MAG: hypothetical protein SVC26_07290 [Pseudomonadota bacterium]|nr:hypothetical protein [Pseudomonadota bacterium]
MPSHQPMVCKETQFDLETLFHLSNGWQIDSISYPELDALSIQLDVLRADLLHPQVSGNKLYKLWPYLFSLISSTQFKRVLSFGGAHSNHLYALGFACQALAIPCTAIVRGGELMTPTLQALEQWGGVALHRMTRAEYQRRHESDWIANWQKQYPNSLIVPEGGSGLLGLEGCHHWGGQIGDENQNNDAWHYDRLAIAVGTGTSALGLAMGSQVPVIGVICSRDTQLPERMRALKTPYGRHAIPAPNAAQMAPKKGTD